MFVDKNGHPIERRWQDCAVCGFPHYDVSVYKEWLTKYKDLTSRPKSKQQEQIERWRGIVERHA